MVVARAVPARRSARTTGRGLGRRRLLGPGVLVALVLLAGGCGSSGVGSTSAAGGSTTPASSPSATTSTTQGATLDTSVDPCGLLTAAQVTKAIGLKAGAGTPGTSELSPSKDCTWTTKFGEGADYNCASDVTSVVLEVVAPPPALKDRFSTASAWFAQLRSTTKVTGHTPKTVSSIGDDAFEAVLGAGKGLDVYATSGNVILRVFSDCGAPDRLRPALESLLSQAVANL